jgi:hypothetical protein
MQVTKAVQERFDTQFRILGKLYTLFPVGEEQHGTSVRELLPILEEPEGSVTMALRTFEELGILSRTLTFEGYQKQQAHLTMLIPKHEGEKALESWHERQRMSTTPLLFPSGRKLRRGERQRLAVHGGEPQYMEEPEKAPEVVAEAVPEKVAITDSPKEEVKAIAGPDAPSPWEKLRPLRRDEARALVEAARQYQARKASLYTKLDELREAGFTVPDVSAFNFQTDDRLETIGLVIPFFNELENENRRTVTWVEKVKTLQRENDELRRRVRALEALQNARVADRVQVTVGAARD